VFALGAGVSTGTSNVTIWLVVGIAVAIASAGIALAALWTTKSSNTRRTLSELLERLEATRLDLLMWRMDQLTRRGDLLYSVNPRDVDQLERDTAANADELALVRQALSQDWGSLTAHMIDVYHFALRVHAWLGPDKSAFVTALTSGMRNSTKTRLLNDTFGYRLLSMFLDHRIIACRLRTTRAPDTYYATHYGLFDPRYTALVQTLFDDLVYGPNMGANLWVVPKKHEAVTDYLRDKTPIAPPPSRDDDS
jgi:hypothetical protein